MPFIISAARCTGRIYLCLITCAVSLILLTTELILYSPGQHDLFAFLAFPTTFSACLLKASTVLGNNPLLFLFPVPFPLYRTGMRAYMAELSRHSTPQ